MEDILATLIDSQPVQRLKGMYQGGASYNVYIYKGVGINEKMSCN
jgi:HD superfamily phosphohydrolase